MSNQNLNTLNVKILNYTADYIYHRGTPIYLDGSGVGGLWSKGTGDNIYYDKGNGTVSIGTTDTSGSLYVVKPDSYVNDYGPTRYPPNLYLQANFNGGLNSTAVLKFSAAYTGAQVKPAYIWHGYGQRSTGGTTMGHLSITANGYTSFNLDGEHGYIGIGSTGQDPSSIWMPTHPLDVSGNTLIRGDLQVGQPDNRSQLTLYCDAHINDPSPALKGLRIWDDAFAGLYTKLRTNTYTTQLAMGISYDNSGLPAGDIEDVLVLQARNLGSGVVGAVGIGIYEPTETLDVSGSTRLRGALYDAANHAGTAGQVLTSTVSGTEWAAAGGGGGGGGLWSSDTSGTIYYDISGDLTKVGIGKNNPTAMLDVSGNVFCRSKVRIGPLDATFPSPNYISDASDTNLEILSNYTSNNFAVNTKRNPNALRIIAEVNIPVTSSGIQEYGYGVEMINFTPYMPSNTDERYKHNVSASIIAGVSPLPNNWGNTKGYLAFSTSSQLNALTHATQLIEKMRIRSDGRVGIGTQYPAAMLDISANQWNKVSTSPPSNTVLPPALQTKGQVKMFPPLPSDMVGTCLLDVSGNVKVSGIYFYDASGSSITGGNSLDISSNTVYFKNKGGQIPITVDISGNIKISGALHDSTNDAGLAGQVLSSTVTGTDWIDAAGGGGGGLWSSGGVGTIYYDGSGGSGPKVGIGTTSPATALDVSGILTVRDGTIDMSGDNLAIGKDVFDVNKPGNYNTAVGSSALRLNSQGNYNTAMGYATLENNQLGSNNTAMGYGALTDNMGSGTNDNTAFGYKALWSNTSGFGNTASGSQSLLSNLTASFNTAFGVGALSSNTIGPNNTAVGYDALTANTDASCNTAFGVGALSSNTIGPNNTAVGYDALTANTDASCNTAVGFKALYSNTTGSGNTATGYRALHNTDTIFAWNTATGSDALFSNTIGTNNVAIGYKTLYTNVDGHNNIAIGTEALYDNSGTNASPNSGGSDSIAIGYRALFKNDVGKENIAIGSQTLSKLFHASHGVSYNTAIGNQAMMNNTNGQNNTAVGEHAMGFTNDSGDENTAIGGYTLYNNGGLFNTAIGYKALYECLDGEKNVAVGWQSLYDCSDGSCNVAIGYQALHNSSGTYNTAIGHDAGQLLFSGNDNIFIGKNAQPGGTGPSSTDNQIVIGSNNTGLGDNTVALGNTYVVQISGQVGFTQYSDSRIKKNITDSDLGLDFINKLRPIKYNKVNPADYPEPLLEKRYKGDNPDSRKEDDPLICDGLIAQEVEEVLKHLGKTWSGHSANITDGKQGLQYAALTVPLVKAVQELTDKLAAMEARLTAAGL